MSRKIRLSESELVNLINRVVSEQTPEELGYVKADQQGESATWTEEEKSQLMSQMDDIHLKIGDIHKSMTTPSKPWLKEAQQRIKEQAGPNWQTVQQQWAGGVPPSPPQAFLNNMANMGCAGMNSRLTVLYNKLTNQLGGGGGPQGVSGTHPLWQSQLASKIYWLAYEGIPNCQ